MTQGQPFYDKAGWITNTVRAPAPGVGKGAATVWYVPALELKANGITTTYPTTVKTQCILLTYVAIARSRKRLTSSLHHHHIISLTNLIQFVNETRDFQTTITTTYTFPTNKKFFNMFSIRATRPNDN